MTPVALTIAGSDPSGGAGIQADLKTFHQHGVYGEAVVTLLTVQNTRAVTRVECLDPALIAAQIEAVLADIPPAAAKTGAMGNAGIIAAVAATVGTVPLIVDPVMISKHGAPLIDADARGALRRVLLPKALLVTPNLHEAAALAEIEVVTREQMLEAGLRLLDHGPFAVLVKGGHLEGRAADLLVTRESVHWFESERIDTQNTHGTGCTYSAAITANLARGLALHDALAGAKAFISEAIRTNPGLGHGQGPVNHFARPDTAPCSPANGLTPQKSC
ncbi:MAG: bifunctional hydroxymethylpyrimidine kinase/phosphomethylpyrimidine kinase [Acidobacteria bacterium]|nr:bifunctional hydroxymethylpyrimidine kinase/phosphomethylpyrimidine kinase [Acidobacteriota bacterium]